MQQIYEAGVIKVHFGFSPIAVVNDLVTP